MSKLTYGQVLAAVTLLSALPLDVKVKEKGEEEYTRSLDGKLTGRVLSLLANLKKQAKDYGELEEQARTLAFPEGFKKKYQEYGQKLDSCKKEGYDERVKAYQEKRQKENLLDIALEQEIKATEEKLTAAYDEAIEKELSERNSKFLTALKELREQETELVPSLFTEEEFEKISDHLQGAEISINGTSVPRLHWLVDFREILVAE